MFFFEVKDEHNKPKDTVEGKIHVDYHKKDILLANNEAHRLAVAYHNNL